LLSKRKIVTLMRGMPLVHANGKRGKYRTLA
jgi:hypothetical protein